MSTPAVINQTVTATPIAAQTGKVPIVFSLSLTSTAAVTLQFSDTDDVALTGAYTVAANGQLILPYNPDGHFQAASGKGIKLVQTGAGSIQGVIQYHAY